MAHRSLLVVDPDERSRRLLEVSLRKAGYRVEACADAETAMARFLADPADLVITETRLQGGDGFDLMERLRQRPEGRDVPVVLLSSDASVESKVKGLQLGAADYLTKPIYVRELLTRVQVELQRRLGAGSEQPDGARFQGALSDMGLVDLLQTVEVSGKRGVLRLRRGEERAVLWFEGGRVVHAENGPLRGAPAVYRALRWGEGRFDLRFEPTEPPERTVDEDMQSLVMEGLRRLDEWERLVAALPSLDAVLLVEPSRLVERLAEIPDEVNELLRSFDGKRSVEEVVDRLDTGDLEALQAVVRLYEEGILVDSGRRSTVPPPPSAERVDEQLAATLVPASDPPPPGRAEADAEQGPQRAETVPPRATAARDPARPEQEQPENNGETGPGIEAGTRDASLSGGPPARPPRGGASREAQMPKRKGKKRRKKSSASAKVSKKATVIQFPAVAAGAEDAVVETGAAGEGAEREPTGSRPTEAAEAKEAVDRTSEAPESKGAAAAQGEAASSAEETAPKKKRGKGRKKRGKSQARGTERTEAKEASEPAREPVLSEPPEPVDESEVEEIAAEQPQQVRAGGASRKTSSSQMIAALTATGEHAAVTEEFFQKPTDVPEAETWDDLERETAPVAPHEQRARWITIGIVAVGLAAIGGYLLVNKVFMPQPAEVGGAAVATELPELSGEALAEPEEEPMPVAEVPAPPVEDPAAGTAKPAPAPAEQPAAEAQQAEPVAEAQQAEPVAEAEQPAAEAQQAEPVAEAQPVAEAEQPAAEAQQADPAAQEEPAGDYAALLEEARKTRGTRKKIAAFERALEANPDGVDALEELGFLYLNRGKMAEAIRYAERAVQLDPTRSKAWITLGAARQARGDRAGAQQAYRQCVERGQGRFVAECRRMVR